MKSLEPSHPLFYKRYVDDIFVRRSRNIPDMLYNSINDHHKNIKLTLELHPDKFLDTKLCLLPDGTYHKTVHHKTTKLPVHWSSKVPKRYKRNSILGDLHRAKRISDNFSTEVSKIKQKFLAADFPPRFVDSVIKQFMESKEETIVPTNWFDERKFILIELPFCEQNETNIFALHQQI